MRSFVPRLVALFTLALGLPALPAGAQTTPTERAAAADVLERIDALQARIGPRESALERAERSDGQRDRILERGISRPAARLWWLPNLSNTRSAAAR